MGWKNLKEKFGLRHIVQVTENEIWIGSGYVSDLARIQMSTGEVAVNKTFPEFLRETYPSLLAATPADILALLEAPDTFVASIPVFTYTDGEIIELRCEELGWPNVTHDGQLMYNNMFSTDKNKVVEGAKASVERSLLQYAERVAETEAELAKLKARVLRLENEKIQLDERYPSMQNCD